MKICLAPLDIAFANIEENLLTAAHTLNRVESDTDVVVLPELFTTGFVKDKNLAATLAEPNDGRTITTIQRWAQFFGFAICGSFLATDRSGHLANRTFFVEPGGDTTFSDKRHLFPLSEENKVYTPAMAEPQIIRFRGWSFKLIVCFDLRFPVWCRNRPGADYDVLLVPANWPESRQDQFKLLLAARAVENQSYSVGCNRTGEDDYGKYPKGISVIYDNLGHPIHETRRDGLIYAILDKEELNIGRKRFPAWEATDNWTINF
ncbi:MAG: nitrilase family protein [Duncaniella sp.]|nr:nitrilase family protein [Duncaniella sp.]